MEVLQVALALDALLYGPTMWARLWGTLLPGGWFTPVTMDTK